MALLDQIIAGLVTGLGVGAALRAAAIPGEVSDHDARAAEMAEDHARWVRDRERILRAEFARAENLAKQGVIEDVEQPEAWQTGIGAASQLKQPAFSRRLERLMRQALVEYRDEATRKLREYKAMARSEGLLHRAVRWYRTWRRSPKWPRDLRRTGERPSPLGLPEDARFVAGWRERHSRGLGAGKLLRVEDDPTRKDAPVDLVAIEGPGLTWEAARRGSVDTST